MAAMKEETGRALSVLAHRHEGSAARVPRQEPVLHAAVGRRTLCGFRPLPEHGWWRVVNGDLSQVTCERCLRQL
jgi:hypothetical protein